MKKEFVVKCKNCGKEFKVIEEETKFPIKGEKYFCCRSCANTRHHTKETREKISSSIKNSELFATNNKIAAQKKIDKKLNIKKLHICKNCGKTIEHINEYKFGKYIYCSENCKNIYLQKHPHGGYRKGSGIGKHGWYHGIYCDSTWELAYLIYHIDNNLYIERCKDIRKYIIDNKEHTYIPDFITSEGIIEIKGYITKISEAKSIYNPDIKILYKKDIQFYINYVKEHYNIKQLENLYEI